MTILKSFRSNISNFQSFEVQEPDQVRDINPYLSHFTLSSMHRYGCNNSDLDPSGPFVYQRTMPFQGQNHEVALASWSVTRETGNFDFVFYRIENDREGLLSLKLRVVTLMGWFCALWS
jgi:hypothetical protein